MGLLGVDRHHVQHLLEISDALVVVLELEVAVAPDRQGSGLLAVLVLLEYALDWIQCVLEADAARQVVRARAHHGLAHAHGKRALDDLFFPIGGARHERDCAVEVIGRVLGLSARIHGRACQAQVGNA